MIVNVIYNQKTPAYLDPESGQRYAFAIPPDVPVPEVGWKAVIPVGDLTCKIVRIVEINPNIADLNVPIAPVITTFVHKDSEGNVN